MFVMRKVSQRKGLLVAVRVAIFAILLVSAMPVLLIAQSTSKSDLLFALDTVSIAEKKVDILVELAELTFDSELELSISFSKQAINLAKDVDYPAGVANASKFLGKGYCEQGEFVRALNFLTDALELFEVANDSLEIADVYNYLGNLYSFNGHSGEARRYYIMAELIFEDLQNTEKTAKVLNNLGTLFLGNQNFDSAIFYLDKARLSNLEIKNDEGLTTNYLNFGFAYADIGDHQKAIDFYTQSLDIAVRLNNKANEATANLNIGDSYMNLGDYDLAKNHVKEGIRISSEKNYKFNEYIGSYTLGEIYEKENQYQEALTWYKRAEELDSELLRPESQEALMSFQTAQLQKAQENEIDRITSLNEEQMKSEKLKSYLLLVMAASVLLLLLGTSYFFLRKHKSSIQISIQNEQISAQNLKIMEQAKDISAVNDTLTDRNLRLRKLNDEKNYLMSVVAHDLKSPLNQINGLANVIKLEEEHLTDDQRECLKNIHTASDRLSKMVDKILNQEAIETERGNVVMEEIEVKPLLIETIANFSGLAAKKQIELTHNFPDEPVTLMADRQYLRQVYDNLLSNAIKFSPPGKPVEVNLNHEGDAVVTEIVDEGPGLTDEDMNHVFKEYAVLSAKPTGDEISTGLGLSIVKNYVEKMAGEVWYEKNAVEGATFKVRLDAA